MKTKPIKNMKTKQLAICSIGASLAMATAHASVIAHYTFDTDYTDSSGNAHHGTLVNEFTSGGTFITSVVGDTVFGGGALHVGEDRDYVSIIIPSFSTSDTWTVSLWAMQDLSSENGSQSMVIGEVGTTSQFITTETGKTRFRGNGSGNTADGSGTTAGAWHHYVISSSGTGGDITIWLDGALDTTSAEGDTSFVINAIGSAYASSNNLDFQGRIDEVWILDETADLDLVTSLHTVNAVPEPSSAALLGLGGLALILRRRK